MMSIPVTPYDAKLEPLRAAIEAGNSDVLKQWVQDGLPVYNPESKCDTVLSLAVKNCQFTMLETLLDIGNWQDEYPQLMGLALDAAVRSKQVDVARLLLDKGASVEGVAWWKIADTHSAEMADVFFKRHKSAAGFEEAIDSMEQGFFSAGQPKRSSQQTSVKPRFFVSGKSQSTGAPPKWLAPLAGEGVILL